MYKKHKGHLKRVDPVLVRLANIDIIHCVTDELVTLILQKCDKIFTPDAVLKNFPIRSFQTAFEICTIVSEVFWKYKNV